MDYKVTDTELTSVANAIRTKGGTSSRLEYPDGFISAIQNIPTGATNFVTGTFHTSSTAGVRYKPTGYTGNGYPIMAVVVVEGGAYVSGTTWYNSLQRYAIGQWTMTKSVMDSSPTYTTSGTQNQGVTTWVYKNSTSSATTYSRSSAMTTNVFSSADPTGAGATCIRFRDNRLYYYVNTSSYGLHPDTIYRYFIIYSE